MPISVTPIQEPISHKEAAKLAALANQAAILIKSAITQGVSPQGNNPAISAGDILQHFSVEDTQKLEAIANTV